MPKQGLHNPQKPVVGHWHISTKYYVENGVVCMYILRFSHDSDEASNKLT